ncbi:MAG: homocysteine S-methyltransferase family protein [Nitrospira sp.]|nr:homocysteine S-methyltransferase family protein [Nitrospira sp.]
MAANSDWGAKPGYGAAALTECNGQAVRLLEDIRNKYESDRTPVVISGCIGPRGDGYLPDPAMSEREAEEYHRMQRMQLETFAQTAADLVTAITMTYVEEAIGTVQSPTRCSNDTLLELEQQFGALSCDTQGIHGP